MFRKLFVLMLVLNFGVFELYGQEENLADDELLGSDAIKAAYSVGAKGFISAQYRVGKPTSKVYAYLFFESPKVVSESLISGGSNLTRELVLGAAKDFVESPNKVCEDLANSLMKRGYAAYCRNYDLYKKWKKNGTLSRDERIQFRRDLDELVYYEIGKDLFGDMQLYRYRQGKYARPSEDIKDVTRALAAELARITDLSKAWDVARTAKRVREFVVTPTSLKKIYPPYKNHLENVSRIEKKTGVDYSDAVLKFGQVKEGKFEDLLISFVRSCDVSGAQNFISSKLLDLKLFDFVLREDVSLKLSERSRFLVDLLSEDVIHYLEKGDLGALEKFIKLKCGGVYSKRLQIRIIDYQKGSVILDSHQNPSKLSYQNNCLEVLKAKSNGRGVSLRYDSYFKDISFHEALVIKNASNKNLWIFRLILNEAPFRINSGQSNKGGFKSNDNWPYFRGPTYNNHVLSKKSFPLSFNVASKKNVRWVLEAPLLKGKNSPIVWGNKLFCSGASKSSTCVYCYDIASGKLLWQRAVSVKGALKADVMDEAGHAASTMATDGERVYAIFANGNLVAFDFEGTLVWKKNLGALDNLYGLAASLAVDDKMIFVQYDHQSPEDFSSKLFSINGKTGKINWVKLRPVGSSWSSPAIFETSVGKQLITCSAPYVISYDPTSGKELWRFNEMEWDIASSPIFANDTFLAICPREFVIAFDVNGQEKWRVKESFGCDCTSPLTNGELVWILGSSGELVCLDLSSGSLVWEKDLKLECYASPVLVGNKVYIFAGGTMIVLEVGRQYREISRSKIGERVYASPAFVDGKILVRAEKNIFCIEHFEVDRTFNRNGLEKKTIDKALFDLAVPPYRKPVPLKGRGFDLNGLGTKENFSRLIFEAIRDRDCDFFLRNSLRASDYRGSLDASVGEHLSGLSDHFEDLLRRTHKICNTFNVSFNRSNFLKYEFYDNRFYVYILHGELGGWSTILMLEIECVEIDGMLYFYDTYDDHRMKYRK